MRPVIATILIALPVTIVISLFVQMFVANQSIIYGDTLQRNESRIAELSEQNEYLRQQISTLSSIRRVEREARQLGLHEVTSYMAYDADALKVALKR
jgi:cell division protein FtsL